MDIELEHRLDGVTIMRPAGRLDLPVAPATKQNLLRVIGAGHHRLVVDLEQVTFVDSSGLGALISGLKAARGAGGDLRLARPGEQARVILQLTTLERVLRPYTSVEDALAGYGDANVA